MISNTFICYYNIYEIIKKTYLLITLFDIQKLIKY